MTMVSLMQKLQQEAAKEKLKMTSTVEIVEDLLKDPITFGVLKVLDSKERDLEELFDVIHDHSDETIRSSIRYLDRVALIENVFAGPISYYRISARGRVIYGILKDDYDNYRKTL